MCSLVGFFTKNLFKFLDLQHFWGRIELSSADESLDAIEIAKLPRTLFDLHVDEEKNTSRNVWLWLSVDN